jgi:hypothetical protein
MNRWFRWYEGTTEDGKFRMVARNAGVTVATVIGVWAVLLEDASHSEPPFWSAVLDIDEQLLITILAAMESADMVSVGHGAITITHWKERQFETDTTDPTNADRQRRWREKHKENDKQTERNATVTATKRPETETETETEKKDCELRSLVRSAKKPTRTPAHSEAFDEFWKVYPKREGSNPSSPARKKFAAVVKSGVDPPTIIAAAKAYADEQRQIGKIGTSYVAQAVTWLNQQRWGDYQTRGSPQETAEREMLMEARGYHWTGDRWEQKGEAA